MKVYQRLDVDEKTPAQFVAVHPLRWRPEWGEPSDMFRDVDLIDVPEVAALVEACRVFVTSYEQHYRKEYSKPWEVDYLNCMIAALAPFQEANDGIATE